MCFRCTFSADFPDIIVLSPAASPREKGKQSVTLLSFAGTLPDIIAEGVTIGLFDNDYTAFPS